MQFSFAVTLVLALVAPAFAAQKPVTKPPPKTAPAKNAPVPKLTPFLGKLEEARASAKARNVPLVVHVILEGEISSDNYKKQVLDDADLLRSSSECIVIVSNNGSHPKGVIEEVVDGAKVKREVCSKYPMFASCAHHQQSWAALYSELQTADGSMNCPQTVVYAPDGTIATRINTGNPPEPSEVVAAILEVRAKYGAGLSQAQLDDVLKKLDSGRALMNAQSWAEAWKCWAWIVALTPKSAYGDEASKALPIALAGLQKEYERIAALLVPGTAVKAYQELVAFAAATVGTPLEKDVSARLKKVETDKAIAAEIAAWRLSVEADQLLAEARDAYEQKQEKKGERALRKLFGKRFSTTPAAESARKLWPDIAADEAAKNPPK